MKLFTSILSTPKRSLTKHDLDNAYVFEDCLDRTKGKNKIKDDTLYAKRFGNELFYPSVGSTCLRGLDNAFPITTLNSGEKPWTDNDFSEFKKVIDADFKAIINECKKKKYKAIIFPKNGILNKSKTSISYKRTPKLFKYLIKKEIELAKLEV